jgi:hypothetical protein
MREAVDQGDGAFGARTTRAMMGTQSGMRSWSRFRLVRPCRFTSRCVNGCACARARLPNRAISLSAYFSPWALPSGPFCEMTQPRSVDPNGSAGAAYAVRVVNERGPSRKT